MLFGLFACPDCPIKVRKIGSCGHSITTLWVPWCNPSGRFSASILETRPEAQDIPGDMGARGVQGMTSGGD